MSFIDDPRAENYDKYGRVYRPETIVPKYNSFMGGKAISANENLDIFDRAKRKRKSSHNKVRLPKYVSTEKRVSL
jgi:hypothetical protein